MQTGQVQVRSRKGTPPVMKTNVLIAIISLLWLTALGKDLTSEEINHKAEFIIKTLDYVTWPEGAGTNADGAIVIAVVGESKLTPKLTELAAEKTDEETKIVVETKTLDDDVTACQLLFIATEDKAELAVILNKTKEAPVLTISDSYYFARHGVMVNFYKEEGKSDIKFEVNTITLGFAGLKMSSRLLKLATVI